MCSIGMFLDLKIGPWTNLLTGYAVSSRRNELKAHLPEKLPAKFEDPRSHVRKRNMLSVEERAERRRLQNKLAATKQEKPRKVAESEKCYSCHQKAREKVKRMLPRHDGSFYEVEVNYCGHC